MKKTMMQLAITGLVLASATTVMAGSITSQLQVGYDVTYQLWNAAPRYSYCAVISGKGVGYLTTDKKGRGSLTVHVSTNPTTWGNWIGLRETDGQLSTCTSPLPPYVPQALMAAPNPFNPPPPATP